MPVNKHTRDKRSFKRLLHEATRLKVFEARQVPSVPNVCVTITDEALSDKAHITFFQLDWSVNDGGTYKICIYTPSIGNRANIRYIQGVVDNISNALDARFGHDCWNECNKQLLETWRPLSRFSYYVQIPNFN